MGGRGEDMGVECRKGGGLYLCDCHSLAGAEIQKNTLEIAFFVVAVLIRPHFSPFYLIKESCNLNTSTHFI